MANNLSSKEQKFTENNEILSTFNIHIYTSVQIAAKFFSDFKRSCSYRKKADVLTY